jgi:translocation and assembly module TamB
MSNSAPDGLYPPSSSQRSRFNRFSKVVLSIGMVPLVGGLGVWYALDFIQRQLAPMVAQDLSQSLNRPVNIGAVQRYSLTELEFGPSAIPPCTPNRQGCTRTDADTATLAAIRVSFNLWDVVWTRTLNLDVTLVQPDLYLDQTAEGRWLSLPPQKKSSGAWIKTRLQILRVQQGQVRLAPFANHPRQLKQVQATVHINREQQTLEGTGAGELDSGGSVTVKGRWHQSRPHLTLTAQTNNLVAAPLMVFLPRLPFEVNAGRLNGQVQITYQPSQPLQINPNVTLTAADVTVPVKTRNFTSLRVIRLQAEQLKGALKLQIKPRKPVKILGRAWVKGADVAVPEDLILSNGRSRRQPLTQVQGTVRFLGSDQSFAFNLKGQLPQGGKLKGQGVASFLTQRANLQLQAQNVPAPLLDQAFELPLRVQSGHVDANLNLKLRRRQRPILNGTAQVKKVTAQIMGVPQPFRQMQGRLRFRGLATKLENVSASYGQIPLQGNGWIDPDRGYNLTAQTQWVEANKALKTLGVTELPFPVVAEVQGQTLRVTGAIERPLLTGAVAAQGTPKLDRVPFRHIAAQFELEPPVLRITHIQARPLVGGIITGQAQYDLEPQNQVTASFQTQDVPGNALAHLYGTQPPFEVGLLSAQTQLFGPPDDVTTRTQFQAPEALYPTKGQITLRQGKATLEKIVARVAGADLNIRGQIVDDQVEAIATTAGIPLQPFSPELSGHLSGQLTLAGPFSTFSPATVRAQGSVRFSQGLSLIQDPITAQVRWDGTQILVPQATAPGFWAKGWVGAQLEGLEAPKITTLDLQVQAQAYDLQALSTLGIPEIALQGRADVQGHLTGTLMAPHLQASLQVNPLVVQDLAFATPLVGSLNYDAEDGIDLNLDGGRDRLHLALTSTLEPQSFDIRWNQATAHGHSSGEQLQVNIRRFPLAALRVSPFADYGLGPISGLASGEFDVHWGDRSFQGGLVIVQPGVGPLRGDLFTGYLRYTNAVAQLERGALIQGENHILMNGTLEPGPDPKFAGHLQIQQAQIANVLTALDILTSNSEGFTPVPTVYGTAADVQTTPINLAQAPIFTQIQRLAELEDLFARQQQQAPPPFPFPELSDLKGKFEGNIQVSGTAKTGVQAEFALQGQSFAWGEYALDRVAATGTWGASGLTLEPLRIESGESFVAFAGRLGEQEQSGQLTLDKLPIQELTPLLKLPVDVSGHLGGTTTLSGSLLNPRLTGRLQLTDALLNQRPVDLAETTFTYDQGRLNFEGRAKIEQPDPIVVTGSIPYQLPFAAVGPSSDQLEVKGTIANQGLSLLNLFTDQVTWVDGSGNLDIFASGTLAQPVIQGELNLNNVTLQSQLLTDPLTQISGQIQFDRNHIIIPKLTGTYNEGQILATGSLPLFELNPLAPSLAQPLTVNLNKLDLNLDLYQGKIDGYLLVQGTALQPLLGGSVTLDSGQVLLTQATPSLASPVIPPGAPTPTNPASTLQFQDLLVKLGDGVRVHQPPLLDFLATGNLTLRGSVTNPLPQGQIQFRKGKVNLFTTLFLLDRRRQNIAQFDPRFGTDPYLNLGLVTTVTSAINRTTTLNELETRFTNASAIDSIRIRANVDGRASDLINNFDQIVELSSSPNRERQEIVALLGGGFTDPLERGETGVALANLAGSAVSTGVQNLLSDALGSRVTLRAFPLLIPDDQNKDRSVLQFGGELGYNVTDRFSVSALQVLTDSDRPILFNFSYDINDQLRVRSVIGADGEAAGVLEYRLQF